jgi:hypothetical protein
MGRNKHAGIIKILAGAFLVRSAAHGRAGKTLVRRHAMRAVRRTIR